MERQFRKAVLAVALYVTFADTYSKLKTMDLSAMRGYLAKFNLFSNRLTVYRNDTLESQDKVKTDGIASSVPSKVSSPKSVSYLASDVVIEGSFFSDTDVYIEGRINGGISSKGNVEIRGKADGDLYGTNVTVHLAEVTGNVRAAEYLLVRDSVINGDVFAVTAEIDGVVNGNISADGNLIVRKSAVITGDICAASISIEEKAVLDGKVCVKRG